MAAYQKMKDSGIAWLGQIPSHWKVERGKNALKLLDRPVKEDDEIITCFRDGEVTLRKKRREEGFTVSLKEIGYQGIEKGDLVVHGMDGFAGAIGVSDSRGKATPVLNVMDSTQNKRYLMYYLRVAAYKDVFMSLSTGIRVRSCDLRWNKLSVFPFLIPSIGEQNAIVNFIDKKVTEIDSLISEAKSSIEEYKKWKASIIYEAVTKGIDPNVETKSINVVGAYNIPAHWDTVSLRYLIDVLTDYTANGSFGDLSKNVNYIENSGFARLVRLTDLRASFKNDGVYVDEHAYEYLSKSCLFGGEILIANVGAYAGLAVEMPKIDFKATLGPNMFLLKVKPEKLMSRFAYYSLIGDICASQLKMMANITTAQPKLNKENLRSVTTFLPPLEEQKSIVKYLDKKIPKFNSLIAEKQALISDLEAYKKSLIYEVVTGKRRVD